MFRRLPARATVLVSVVLAVSTFLASCTDATGLPSSLADAGAGEDTAFRREGVGRSPKSTVASIEISPAEFAMAAGNATVLTAVARNRDGRALNTTPVWITSDPAVAVVSNGSVQALKPGIAFVTAMVGGVADTAIATVTAVVLPVASVVVSPSAAALVVGETRQFAANPVAADGISLADRPVAWSSSNEQVVRVSETGEAVAVSPGSATLAASAAGVTSVADVTVSPTPAVPVAAVTVTPAPASLTEGTTLQLHARVTDGGGAELADRPLTWVSSNEGVVKVSGDGLVSGIAAGTSTVTATAEGRVGAATVTVTPSRVAVANISLSTTAATIDAGASLQLVAVPHDAAGNELSGRAIAWTTSDAGVASVSSSGLVRGLAGGSATITAEAEGKTAAAALTVTAAPLPAPTEPTPPPTSPTPTPAEPTPEEPTPEEPAGDRVGYYVSPSGSSSGAGSKASPWDLTSVLRGSQRVAPGDTVWLRGGTYRGAFQNYLNGTAGRLIVLRALPGERATIDGDLAITGSYVAFWGIEVMNSAPNRYGGGTGRNGINQRAPGSKLINMVVHDIGQSGIGTWKEAPDAEVYGSIVYNVGWHEADRGHGHSLYVQNLNGTKSIRDNIMFNNFAYGVHAYGETNQYLRNIVFEGNVVFNSGTLAQGSPRPDYMIGGWDPATGIVYRNNFSWRNDGGLTANLSYGGTTNRDLTYVDNYFVGSVQLDPSHWASIHQSGNSVVSPSHSGSMRVVVRPNAFEQGRANVIVYNWGGAGAASADLSGVLRAGDAYEVRNVQDFYGAPVATGTFGGGSISIPLNAVAPPSPIGGSPRAPVSTGSKFHVFVVLKR